MPKDIESRIEQLVSPFQDFVRNESASSSFLFIAAVAALIAANSGWSEQYTHLVHLPIELQVGGIQLQFSPRHLINDGLMALFFMVLGLEIKREILVGELRDRPRAIPVFAGALGGMLVPAGIYVALNLGESSLRGWGIPMATDAAFALGVLMLLGNRVPDGLKAFLVAYAIIDDLGAILVIATFYSSDLDPQFLAASAACIAALVGCNLLGVRRFGVYLAVGIVLWGCLVRAGVHGTLAGVLVAFAVPSHPRHEWPWLVRRTQRLTRQIQHSPPGEAGEEDILAYPEQHRAVEEIEQAARESTTPLRRWERSLQTPVLWLILPLFALANAGVPLNPDTLTKLLDSPVAWGIAGGLLAGKTLGISLCAALVLRLGWGRLPAGVTLRHVVGLALLGGMGFTLSIFIAGLTFSSQDELNLAKSAIIIASAAAGVAGYLWLRFSPARTGPARTGPARAADAGR